MASRRLFLGGLLSTLGAGSVGAQTLPMCFATSDRFGTWTITTTLLNGTNFRNEQADPNVVWRVGSPGTEARFEGFDSLNVTGTGNEKGRLEFVPMADGRFRGSLSMPRLRRIGADRSEEIIGDDFLLGRTATLNVTAGDRAILRIPNVTSFRDISLGPISGYVESILRGRGELIFTLSVEGFGTITATFLRDGLTQARDAGPAFARDHAAVLRDAGDCTVPSGCMMTTAAVDMLGRDDACFELRQLRELRAKYAGDTATIEAYLAASRRVLSQPKSLGRSCRVLGFYAAVVWPVALLVKGGWFGAARRWYLAGFGMLFGAHHLS